PKLPYNGLHRAYNIGEGKLFRWEDFHLVKEITILDCEESANVSQGWLTKSNFNQLVTSKSSICIRATLDSNDNRSCGVFECVEEGCIKKFLSYHHLVNHLTVGKHIRKIEKFSLTDTEMKMYKTKIETIEQRMMVSLLLEMSSVSERCKIEHKLSSASEGHGLPPRRMMTRFTPLQHQFSIEKFDEGIRNGIRWKSEAVAEKMQETKFDEKFLFSVEECLTPKQIRSYFSRTKAKRQGLIESVHGDENDDTEAFLDNCAGEEAEERINLSECKRKVDPANEPSRSSTASAVQ
ncbi:unnamed protein product, partial [Didymodactylos carnosus]